MSLLKAPPSHFVPTSAPMINTFHSRRIRVCSTHIDISNIRFAVRGTQLDVQFSIRGNNGILKLTMTRNADDEEWQMDIDCLDVVLAISTVVPEFFNSIELALDDALAEIIPSGRSLPNDDRDYGWAICDERADPDRVLEMGPTATHARMAVMCARGPDGTFKGLVAREFRCR